MIRPHAREGVFDVCQSRCQSVALRHGFRPLLIELCLALGELARRRRHRRFDIGDGLLEAGARGRFLPDPVFELRLA